MRAGWCKITRFVVLDLVVTLLYALTRVAAAQSPDLPPAVQTAIVVIQTATAMAQPTPTPNGTQMLTTAIAVLATATAEAGPGLAPGPTSTLWVVIAMPTSSPTFTAPPTPASSPTLTPLPTWTFTSTPWPTSTPTRRPTPWPTSTPTPVPRLYNDEYCPDPKLDNLAHIRLTILSPAGKAWYDTARKTMSAVEWADTSGGWHAVENWQKMPYTQIVWGVWPRDYGSGPFRWAIYDSGSLIGASGSFYLPTGERHMTDIVVNLNTLPY